LLKLIKEFMQIIFENTNFFDYLMIVAAGVTAVYIYNLHSSD